MTSPATPQPTESKSVLRYDNLLVSSRGFTEAHREKVVIFAPAAEIEEVRLKFGKSDHRPITSMAVGGILAVLGIYSLVELFIAPALFRYEIGLAAFGLIGCSMIYDALKKRYFFEVQKKKGHARLVFSGKAQLSEIQEFCRSVRETYPSYIIIEEI